MIHRMLLCPLSPRWPAWRTERRLLQTVSLIDTLRQTRMMPPLYLMGLRGNEHMRFLPFGLSLMKTFNQFPSNFTLTLVIFVWIPVKISTTHMGWKLLGPSILLNNDSAPSVKSTLNPRTRSPSSLSNLIIDTIAKKVYLLFLKKILNCSVQETCEFLCLPVMVMSLLYFDQNKILSWNQSWTVHEKFRNCVKEQSRLHRQLWIRIWWQSLFS